MNSIKIMLELPEENVKAILDSIEPETKSELMRRSKVLLEGDDGKLTLNIKADDLPSLRACLNTYMRWIIMVYELLEVN
ncbi:MAG: KEOPS complex subunit Pcc1 [Methanobacteriota archaeon]